MTVSSEPEASPQTGRGDAQPDLRGSVDDAMRRMRPVADDARRRAVQGAAAARDWAVDQSDVLRDTVQTRPFLAVGACAACAFVAGLLLGRTLARR